MRIRNRLGLKLHSDIEKGQDSKITDQKVHYHAHLIETVGRVFNKLLKKDRIRKTEQKMSSTNSTPVLTDASAEYTGDVERSMAVAQSESDPLSNGRGHESNYDSNPFQSTSHNSMADLVARNQFLANTGKPTEDLSQLGKQITDIDGLIEGSYGIAKAASVSGKKTQIAGEQTNSSGKLLVGKAMSMIGVSIGTSVGISSTIHQAYKTENSLKKAGNEAVELIEKLSVNDILKERKGIGLNKKVTQKEVEILIRKKLGDKIAKKTTYAGLTGAFTAGGLLGTLSVFFPPLAIAAVIGLTVGISMTLLFRVINKKRMESNLSKIFRKLYEINGINKSEGNITGLGKVVLNKIKGLNSSMQQRTSSISGVTETKGGGVNRMHIDNSLSAIGYTSGAFGILGRLVSAFVFVAIGLGALASFTSAIFTGVINYRDRQKRLKAVYQSIKEAMIPNVMGRSFPYFRESLFKCYVKSHRSELIRMLNIPALSTTNLIINVLNKEENRELKNNLKSRCVKYCIRKEFCSYAGIKPSELTSVSKDGFDEKFGSLFKRFLIAKFSEEAFKDTVKAGATGCLGISGGFLTLSFFPGIAILTLPMAGLTAVLGGLIVFLAAKYEQNKFKHAARLALNDKHLDINKYNQMKHLVCSAA